ncbi:hypothetical protein AAFC00_004654 [Neodothiora populina]|uniref:Uncharacterized protein n=1 Tax=Neodothiora populina TaxID=2781224 RepID=A0ABR3P3I6_9PEZI
MASTTQGRAQHIVDENMENANNTPRKMTATKPGPFANMNVNKSLGRPALRDLTPNKPIAKGKTSDSELDLGMKSVSSSSSSLSPLKRGFKDILDSGKGFTYLKRRRLSQGQSVTSNVSAFARRRPDDASSFSSSSRHLPPPTSNNDARRSPEKESDEDSGRGSQDSNRTRGSFDSLINYDPSSQQALASQALNFVAPSVAAHTTHTPATARQHALSASDSLRSRAEMLNMRLKVAIYKVRTNQVNVPFSRLRLPDSPKQATPYPARREVQFDFQRSSDANNTTPPTSPPSHPRVRTVAQGSGMPYGLGLLSAPDMTPNIFSGRFMPMQRGPSSSPPIVHIPPSSLPRHAATRETPFVDRVSQQQQQQQQQLDHDSLDSEATELAEDMHDGHEHAESPTTHSKPRGYSTGGLPR